MKLFIFPTPVSATATLSHDIGWQVAGVTDIHPTGRVGLSFTIPANTPDRWGASLSISAPDRVTLGFRGTLMFGANELAGLLCDDFPLPTATSQPPGPPVIQAKTPLQLIEQVASTGKHDLTTHDGCGQFTEDCCAQLHQTFSDQYGHIRKNPGQNQYNGHAVDAINLLTDHANFDGTTTPAGIYDIIAGSEAPGAHPAFNLVGPPDPSLWYFPA